MRIAARARRAVSHQRDSRGASTSRGAKRDAVATATSGGDEPPPPSDADEADSTGLVALATVRVGDRIRTAGDEACTDATPWAGRNTHEISLRALARDATLRVELLRPEAWVRRNHAREGAELYLEFPELRVSGWFVVERVTDGPEVPLGDGCVVTATTLFEVEERVRTHFADGTSVVGTAHHPIWSETRERWVGLGELEEGESVGTHDERPVAVERVEHGLGPGWVYNLTVDRLHTYAVGDAGVVAHNAAKKCNQRVSQPQAPGGGGIPDRHGDFHGPWRPDPGPDGPPGYSSWGDYFRSAGGGPVPHGQIPSPHAHHSVQRHGSGSAVNMLSEIHDLFRRRGGINAHFDLDNLAYSTLGAGNHGNRVVRDQLRRIRALDAANGTPEQFRTLLQTFTREANARTAARAAREGYPGLFYLPGL